MRRKDLVFIICFFILASLSIIAMVTFFGIRYNKINKQEKLENKIQEMIKEQYDYSFLVYKPQIEKVETRIGLDTGKEIDIYTARVIYYDLQYTYEDVWIVVVTEEKIQINKVRE